MIIDLRSDTITRPTVGMMDAMMHAPVGDDVFGNDPTVNALQEKAAQLFGMEAALFCASGTMTNQLALRVHTVPGSDVVCDKNSHIYVYEGGGIMMNSLASVRLIDGDRGRITAQQVKEAIRADDDIHATFTKVVSLENTMNKGGGSCYELKEIEAIQQVCREKKVALHLDGARLFNAIVETNTTPFQYGQLFDTISICLSKGLGCPVGSLLLGSKEHIRKAKRYRKIMGGGWRQAGFLAAAGIYALDHHIERLKDDHVRAKEIASLFSNHAQVKHILPVDTNIVLLRLQEDVDEKQWIAKLTQKDILAVSMGKGLVRFVTHLDFLDTHLEELKKRVASL